MTATATHRRIEDRTPTGRLARHGLLKVLHGTAWKRGWLIAAHDDRLMAYPTGGFNNATTATNGGPLQAPGADANGGIRVIAKAPRVGYSQTVSGGGTISVTVAITTLGYNYEVIVSAPAATTANAIEIAVRSSEAADLIDITHTGTGAGVAVTLATAAVPFVKIYGVSGGEVTSTEASADLPLEFGSEGENFYGGNLGMYWDGNLSVPMPDQIVYAVDNQTVTTSYAPLCLPMKCNSYENDLVFCEF